MAHFAFFLFFGEIAINVAKSIDIAEANKNNKNDFVRRPNCGFIQATKECGGKILTIIMKMSMSIHFIHTNS